MSGIAEALRKMKEQADEDKARSDKYRVEVLLPILEILDKADNDAKRGVALLLIGCAIGEGIVRYTEAEEWIQDFDKRPTNFKGQLEAARRVAAKTTEETVPADTEGNNGSN